MAEGKVKAGTIDCTPTWEATARMLCTVMECGTDEGKAIAGAELVRMGKLLDQLAPVRGTEEGATDGI